MHINIIFLYAVITDYAKLIGAAANQKKYLKKLSKMLILDELHKLKNCKSRTHIQMKLIQRTYILMLTEGHNFIEATTMYTI